MISLRKARNLPVRFQRAALIAAAGLMIIGTLGGTRLIGAQSLQQQINELTVENNQTKAQLEALKIEASSYEDAINALAAQINAYQAEINKRQAEAEELKRQIAIKEEELVKQRAVLGENIKAMYLEGNISTIEMLATSKSLSDYFDKQQYREIASNNMKATLDNITKLKAELQAKKAEIERIIKQQEELRSAAAIQKAEQDRLLGMNKSQQNEFSSQMKANQERIADLKYQQYLENVRKYGGGGGQVGGGGYPWGNAPCLHGGHVQGFCYDYEWGYNGPGSWRNWANGGYAYRNCTDYVAWKTGASGGLGNANTWYARAPAYGYDRGRTPRVGAAAVDIYGTYGHVMYVEAVNGDGSILISDYNRAGPGEYGVKTLSAGVANSLHYVYF